MVWSKGLVDLLSSLFDFMLGGSAYNYFVKIYGVKICQCGFKKHEKHYYKLGTKVLMPRVDYASLQPCCSLWLFVQLELYSALSLDYAVVVAMSCFCMCYATQ